jgi:hypothetical protein
MLLLSAGYLQAELQSAVHSAVRTLSYSLQCTVPFVHSYKMTSFTAVDTNSDIRAMSVTGCSLQVFSPALQFIRAVKVATCP